MPDTDEGLNYMNNNNTNKCWYCGKSIYDDRYNKIVPLYKEVSRYDGLTSRNVTYKKTEISIPRCQQCSKSDKALTWISYIFLFCIIIGASFVLIYTEGHLWWLTVLISIALLVLFGYVVNKVLDNKTQKTGVKYSLDGHPIVEAMEKLGWSLNKPQA